VRRPRPPWRMGRVTVPAALSRIAELLPGEVRWARTISRSRSVARWDSSASRDGPRGFRSSREQDAKLTLPANELSGRPRDHLCRVDRQTRPVPERFSSRYAMGRCAWWRPTGTGRTVAVRPGCAGRRPMRSSYRELPGQLAGDGGRAVSCALALLPSSPSVRRRSPPPRGPFPNYGGHSPRQRTASLSSEAAPPPCASIDCHTVTPGRMSFRQRRWAERADLVWKGTGSIRPVSRQSLDIRFNAAYLSDAP
jgi:hypothetical protein